MSALNSETAMLRQNYVLEPDLHLSGLQEQLAWSLMGLDPRGKRGLAILSHRFCRPA